MSNRQATADNATPRPWTLEVSTEGDDGMTIAISEINRCLHDWEWADTEDWDRDLANADLIVTAVNERDALIAERDRLREALNTLRHHLQKQPDVVRLIDTALSEQRVARADWCDVCHAPQMVLPNGEHVCGVETQAILAINAAATEICDYCGIDQNDAEKVVAIISRHCAALSGREGEGNG